MRGLAPYWIDPRGNNVDFPDVSLALKEPDGLLAIGGDLKPQRLLAAYRQGIFPWYNEGQPILWWAPNPRTVLFPQQIKISRSLRKTLRNKAFTVSLDRAFAEVIEACSGPRPDADNPGTWITHEMKQAYLHLHKQGHAHSVECWHHGQLVGGLYGVGIGRVFFGESMFTRCSDASKVAFVALAQQLAHWDFGLIDCQIHSLHLESLGAENIERAQFMALLNKYCEQAAPTWQFEPSATGDK
jgi:leucyl/phenylalanyl-tRNA---protein transferase